MPWYSGLVVIILLLTGCMREPQIGEKSFDKEDEFIIKGLIAQEENITKSINIFNNLYEKTDKYIYLQKVIDITFANKEYNKTITLVDEFVKKYPNYKLKVLNKKVYAYIKQNKINKALEVTKNILKTDRDLDTYKLIAYIYIKKKNYKEAIKYLKSAYAISHQPQILAQMGDIFFKYLNKPNEAISYYQTHIRLYGCDIIICNRLAEIYRFLYDYDNLVEIYKKLYTYTNNIDYARKIVFIYLENKEYQKALKFVKKNRLNFSYIIYKARLQDTHNPEDAYRLYKYTNDIYYLFLYSVYKYDKSEKSLLDLDHLINNLYFVISKKRDPLYLNYLGYTLIDYDINPKKGVELVKEALKLSPNQQEYLDSLAWGYYKLKKCKKAYEIISKINLDDKEVKKHKKIIRRCYDTRKNHSKNKRKLKKR